MNKKTKLNLRLVIAMILTIVGSGLLIAGFTVPPLGVIDSSILVAYGEVSTFIASVLGIDYSYKYKTYKRNLIDKLKDDENDDDE